MSSMLAAQPQIAIVASNLSPATRRVLLRTQQALVAALTECGIRGHLRLQFVKQITIRDNRWLHVGVHDGEHKRIQLKTKIGDNSTACVLVLHYTDRGRELYAALQIIESRLKTKQLDTLTRQPVAPAAAPAPAACPAATSRERVEKPASRSSGRPPQVASPVTTTKQRVDETIPSPPAGAAGLARQAAEALAQRLKIPMPAHIGLGLYAIALEVTPEMAFEWLDLNTHNRNASKHAIAKYVQDAQAGRWLVHHQGIAFSPDGALIDGQQRLMAVVESLKTLPLVVFLCVPQEAQQVVDQQRSRTLRDTAKLMAFDLGKGSGWVRRMLTGLTDHRGSTVPLSNQSLVAAIEKYRAAYDWVSRELHSHPRLRGLLCAEVGACLIRAYYHVDREHLRRFIQVYMTGMPIEPAGDEGALLLHRFVLNTTGDKRKTGLYGKTLRALQAFLNRQPLQYLKAMEREIYPLPEDPAAIQSGATSQERNEQS